MKVIFTSARHPAALAIRFFSGGCKYHHCGVIYDDKYVIEARMFGGVCAVKLEDFKKRGEFAIKEFELEDEISAQRFLYSMIGSSYDIGGAFGHPFGGRWENKDKWYCSELVLYALKIGGLSLFIDNVNSCTPRDLFIDSRGKQLSPK